MRKLALISATVVGPQSFGLPQFRSIGQGKRTCPCLWTKHMRSLEGRLRREA
jgi:hypothetical protein